MSVRELGNGRKYDYKGWKDAKKAAGLCTSCGKSPRWEDRVRCRECVLHRRELARSKDQMRAKDDLCRRCGAEVSHLSLAGYCASCKEKINPKKRLRAAVMELYGNACDCCGETQFVFLTLDHINNDGNKERGSKGTTNKSFYARILKEKRDDIRILCFNCNCGRAINGGICPHQREKEPVK